MDLRAAFGAGDPILTGVRRLLALVRGLPRDSATARAEIGPDRFEWTTETELMAIMVDRFAVFQHTWLQAHVKEGTTIPAPVFVPRPGEPAGPGPDGRRTATGAEIAAFVRGAGGRVRYTPRRKAGE